MKHEAAHAQAGREMVTNRDLKTIPPVPKGSVVRVEDWWDRVSGRSWQVSDGNPECPIYAMRSSGLGGGGRLPIDDEVIYGKVDGLGHVIHASELDVPA